MNEHKTDSGIVVMSNSSEDQALRLQAARMLLESNSMAKFYSLDDLMEHADRLIVYIKSGK